MYGDGTIYDEKVGKYTYCTVKYYADGKMRRKRFPSTPAGRQEAKAFARDFRRRKEDRDLDVAPGGLTLGAWLLEYMTTYLKPRYRPQTYQRALYAAKQLGPLAAYPLNQVKGKQIQTLYNKLLGTLAPATVYKVHKLLTGAFKMAMVNGLVNKNPMNAVLPPKVTQEEVTVFSFSEIHRLARVLRTDRFARYYPFFYLLLVTGMRVGELMALRIEDIDFNAREIHVCRTKVGRTGNDFNAPKTRAGDRYIPIVYDKALDRLKSLRCAGKVTRMTGLLFRTRSGNAWNYNNVRRVWIKVCAAAGIQLKHIHAFRHTFATYALAKGIPVLEVARILGHSTATTTLSMYGHSMPGYNQRLIQGIKEKKLALKVSSN